MDNKTIAQKLLENLGGSEQNSLLSILQETENDFEMDIIGTSPYYNVNELPSDIKDKDTNLLTLSLNVQSILAKFGSFEKCYRF